MQPFQNYESIRKTAQAIFSIKCIYENNNSKKHSSYTYVHITYNISPYGGAIKACEEKSKQCTKADY